MIPNLRITKLFRYVGIRFFSKTLGRPPPFSIQTGASHLALGQSTCSRIKPTTENISTAPSTSIWLGLLFASNCLPNLDLSLRGDFNLFSRVSNRTMSVLFDPLKSYVPGRIRVGIAEFSQTLYTIETMSCSKDLNIEFFCGAKDQFPHPSHNGIVQPGIDLIDQQNSVLALCDCDCDYQQSPHAVTHTADWHRAFVVSELYSETTTLIAATVVRGWCGSSGGNAFYIWLQYPESLQDAFFPIRQSNGVPYRK